MMQRPAGAAQGPIRRKIAYGDAPSQYGHLYFPVGEHSGVRPLVVLVHGGSWSTEYGLVIYTAIAKDLARRGAVVWNVEYRRVGEADGGWPTTGRDVLAGCGALDGEVSAELDRVGITVNRDHVRLVGHSAGGQLAVWAAAQLGGRTVGHTFDTVVAQSAVLDFTIADVRDKPSVVRLMGRTYEDAPDAYRDASPACQPAIDAMIVAIHTLADEAVDPALSRHYIETVTARGQRALLREVPGESHAAFIDPRSAAHRQTLRELGL